MNTEKYRSWGVPLAFLIAALALGVRVAAFRITESDWDEYMFGLVGREILAGHLPYSTIFDNKPTGLFYLFAAAEWILGPNVLALRALAVSAAAISAALIFQAVSTFEKSKPRLASATAAASFLALSLSNGGLSAMSELMATPFFLVGIYLAFLWKAEKIRGELFCFGAGAAFGMAAQISYLTIPILAFVMLAYSISDLRNRESIGTLVARLSLFALGFILVFVLILVPQFLSGELGSYFSEQLRYHRSYQSKVTLREHLFGLIPLIAKFLAPLSLVLVPFLVKKKFRDILPTDKTRKSAFAIGLYALAGSLIAAFVSGRSYGHYFLLSLPFLSILTGLLLLQLEGLSRALAQLLVMAACGILALRVAFFVNTCAHRQFFPEVIADIVKRHSQPSDAIYVFNGHQAIYYLSGRALVSRYVFPIHYLESNTARSLGINAEEVVASALSKMPKVVVMGKMLVTPMAESLERRLRQDHFSKVDTVVIGEEEASVFIKN